MDHRQRIRGAGRELEEGHGARAEGHPGAAAMSADGSAKVACSHANGSIVTPSPQERQCSAAPANRATSVGAKLWTTVRQNSALWPGHSAEFMCTSTLHCGLLCVLSYACA